MKFRTAVVVVLVTLASCAWYYAAAQGYCTNPQDDGVSLKGLGTTGLADTEGQYTYYFDPCATNADQAGACPSGTGNTCPKSSCAVCQCKPASSAGYPLGSTSAVTWAGGPAVNNNPTYMIAFGPNSNGGRQCTIQTVCGTSGTATLQYVGEQSGTKLYNFTLTSSALCFGGGDGGGGDSDLTYEQQICGLYLCGGWIFIVILCGLCCCYWILGAIIKALLTKFHWKEDLTPTSFVPNSSFWKVFPFMLRDGHVFVFMNIKRGIMAIVQKIQSRRNGGSYETV